MALDDDAGGVTPILDLLLQSKKATPPVLLLLSPSLGWAGVAPYRSRYGVPALFAAGAENGPLDRCALRCQGTILLGAVRGGPARGSERESLGTLATPSHAAGPFLSIYTK